MSTTIRKNIKFKEEMKNDNELVLGKLFSLALTSLYMGLCVRCVWDEEDGCEICLRIIFTFMQTKLTGLVNLKFKYVLQHLATDY